MNGSTTINCLDSLYVAKPLIGNNHEFKLYIPVKYLVNMLDTFVLTRNKSRGVIKLEVLIIVSGQTVWTLPQAVILVLTYVAIPTSPIGALVTRKGNLSAEPWAQYRVQTCQMVSKLTRHDICEGELVQTLCHSVICCQANSVGVYHYTSIHIYSSPFQVANYRQIFLM